MGAKDKEMARKDEWSAVPEKSIEEVKAQEAQIKELETENKEKDQEILRLKLENEFLGKNSKDIGQEEFDAKDEWSTIHEKSIEELKAKQLMQEAKIKELETENKEKDKEIEAKDKEMARKDEWSAVPEKSIEEVKAQEAKIKEL